MTQQHQGPVSPGPLSPGPLSHGIRARLFYWPDFQGDTWVVTVLIPRGPEVFWYPLGAGPDPELQLDAVMDLNREWNTKHKTNGTTPVPTPPTTVPAPPSPTHRPEPQMDQEEITPGPWEIIPYSETEDQDPTGYLIIRQGSSPTGEIADVTREADAKGIAALPEAIRVLERIEQWGYGGINFPMRTEVLETLAKLKSKAEETP